MSWFRKHHDITDHRTMEEQLSAYLDGELSPGEQEAISHHLATCRACQWHLDTLQQTVQWTRELPTIPVPHVFTLTAPAHQVVARQRRWRLVPLLQGATALVALLLVIVVAGGVMWSGISPASAPPPQAVFDNAPASVEMTQAVAMATEAPVAELEVVVETGVAEPLPSPTPQPAEPEGLRPEPAGGTLEKQVVVVPTLTAAEAKAGAMSAEPLVETAREAMARDEGVEAPHAPAPVTTTTEAEATSTASEPTLSAPPATLSPEAPGEGAPTAAAQLKEPTRAAVAEQESSPVRTARQATVGWLRVAALGLAVLLLLLGTLTAIAMILRGRAR